MKQFLAVLTAVFAAAVLGVPGTTLAVDTYLPGFRVAYPTASGSRVDSCSLCHSSVPSRNVYGAAWRTAGRSYAAIDGLDSDGDGFTNGDEIRAFTFPGNAADHPTVADSTPPTVNTFTLPAAATTLTVSVQAFTASDNVGVTGYVLTQSAATPGPTAGWTPAPPTSFTFATTGTHTLYAWARDAAGNVSTSRSGTVIITLPVPDTTAPTVDTFSLPATAASLTVAVQAFGASDNVGVTGYLLSESATTPSATGAGWTASAPAAFSFGTPGTHTLYAWAKDAAGNVSTSRSASVTITLPPAPDTTAPTVDAFGLPATASSLTVDILALAASDNLAVAAYLLTEGDATPSPADPAWTAAAPTTFTFATDGAHTLYAWAKDAAGNVSTSRSATVTIALPPPPDTAAPTMEVFEIPATAASLTVDILALAASDNVGVSGYLVNESAASPLPTAAGWSAAGPANYTFATDGTHTLYAWAKDAAGNVSTGLGRTVTITLPTAPPVPQPLLVSNFTKAKASGDPDWDRVRGGFGGIRGAFVALGAGRNVALADDQIAGLAPYGGGRIDARVRLTNPLPTTQAEILFDYEGARNYRYVRLDNATQRLVIGQVGVVAGQPALRPSSVRLPRLFNRLKLWHRLRVQIDPIAGSVTVYVDNFKAPALGKRFWQTGVGRVGLAATASQRKVAFDNVAIWDTTVLP